MKTELNLTLRSPLLACLSMTVLVTSISCGRKSNDEAPTPASKAQVETESQTAIEGPVVNAPIKTITAVTDTIRSQVNSTPSSPSNTLVGSWMSCTVNGQIASGVKYVFRADGTANVQQRIYRDAVCQVPATIADFRDDIEKTVRNMQATGMSYETAVLFAKSQFESLIDLVSIDLSYKVGEALGGGLTALDVTPGKLEQGVSSDTVYLSFKIDGDKLTVTDTCTDSDVTKGKCKVQSGSSPANRAVDLNAVTKLLRQAQ